MKHSNAITGVQTRDFRACSAVPQPTASKKLINNISSNQFN